MLAYLRGRAAAHLHAVAVAIATLAAGVAVPAIAFGQCIGPPAIAQAAENIGAFISDDLRDDDARAWVAAYNATPGIREEIGAADQIVVVDHPARPTVFVWALRAGCAVAGGEVARALAGQIMDTVLGAGS